jgi:hypothetical protein
VEAVGDLHEQHSHIAGCRHHHLAQVLGARVLGCAKADAIELGNPVDQQRHGVSHLPLDVDQTQRGVLDRVVQESGRYRRLIEPELGADRRDAQWVGDEGIARLADLARVGGLGDLEGAFDELGGAAGPVRPELLEKLFEARIAGLAGRSHPAQDRLDASSRRLVRRRLFLSPLLNRVHIPL